MIDEALLRRKDSGVAVKFEGLIITILSDG